MNVDAALTVFGLTLEATPADVGETYRKIRKPILKELNKYDDADQPVELVEKLEAVDTAYKILQKEIKPPPRESVTQTGAGSTTKRTTGRVAFAQGDVLAGRYEIESLIAHRPEGDTYSVHDRVRGISLGMKVIAPQLMAEPRRRARLLRGLWAASRLNHPHVARVLDIHPLQHTFAVTLQIPPDGENLWDLMYGAEGKRDRLNVEVVLGMSEQATQALAYVHTLTPHAALRPESIWLAPDGTVKIADFGFADVQRQLRERRLSRSKLGTAYWAPEQYRDDAAVDGRSDQYSFALILYEILSGKPLVGRTEKIRSFRKDYPQRFTDAVERALSSKPGRRFDDMNAFGDAAVAGYRAEGMGPTGVSRESMLIPTLLLFALFAGLAFSPVGRIAADRLGAAVGNWRRADQQVGDADRDLRRLRAMSARLNERADALDEGSREELGKVRAALAEEDLDAAGRGRVNDDLAEIVRKLVADSYRRAETGMAAASSALEALERRGHSAGGAAKDAASTLARDFDTHATAEERDRALLDLLRLQAARARADTAWRAQRAEVRGAAPRAAALRSLLQAEAALAIGDETATGKAYDAAAGELVVVGEKAATALAAIPPFTPEEKIAGSGKRVEGEDRAKLLGVLLESAGDSTDDPDLARVLDGLRREAFAGADVRWRVHDEGYWTFYAALGGRSFLAGGTWRGAESTQRMRVLVYGGRLLDTPYEIAASRGGERPGLGDLRAALEAGPRDARAWWSVRRVDAHVLPASAFTPAEQTVRAGTLTVMGSVAAGEPVGVLVDGRRFEAQEGAFEARIRVSGDVLGAWVRAHAVKGVRSSAGGWLRLETDYIAPRVQVLEPAEGTTLDGNTDVTVRALLYDSNLVTLEIGGEPQSLRRDDVYVLVEIPLRTPARGRLTVPLRAVDAAGNETTVDLDWAIR